MSKGEEIRVQSFTEDMFGVNSYLIVCGGHALMIDPVLTPEMEDAARAWQVDFALLTHEHYDHIRSVPELRERLHIPVYCGEKAQRGLADPVVNMSRYAAELKRFIPFGKGEAQSEDFSCRADGALADGQQMAWQGHALLIRETPGHSAGSISILLDGRSLFTGDTLFRDYPTATRMPGGSTKGFRQISEPWFASLPEETLVYPGHTAPFPLGERHSISH